MIRRYSELNRLKKLSERYEYLKLDGQIGKETFGWDRWINQAFYSSPEWKAIRDQVIIRDNGNELGVDGYEIRGRIYVHHMNPVNEEDILAHSLNLIDPEFLICCSFDVHQAIHYGNENLLPAEPVIRRPNDTCPWR